MPPADTYRRGSAASPAFHSGAETELCRLPGLAVTPGRGNCTIRNRQRLIRTERILAHRQRLQLVELTLDGQMRSFASDVGKVDNERRWIVLAEPQSSTAERRARWPWSEWM